MTEHEAFLRAVIAEPDEDAPRLVYADWLEERGDPRGEFIRLQCTLAAREPRRDLAARADALREEHEDEWVGPIRGLAQGWKFRRGFIEDVTVAGPTFLVCDEELFRLAPIRHLRLTDAVRHLPSLTLSPALAGLRALDLSHNRFGCPGAQVVAGSSYLGSLTALQLRSTGLEAAGVAALAESLTLARLTLLDLSGNSIGVEGLRALARSPYLGRRAPLSVRYDPIPGADRRELQQGFGPRLEFV
jgi:uncharacterized protein (TIGR02996 family)